MSRPISASSGGSSGGGGTVSDLAGSPISLMRPSMPAGERMNNGLAGPELAFSRPKPKFRVNACSATARAPNHAKELLFGRPTD
jgi:hypothetical protein